MKFYNKTLNKKFWSEDNKFNPDIREKLLSITNDFIDKLDLDGVEIHDVTLTGSNSNYNYNDYSDLDVHVLIDFKDKMLSCFLFLKIKLYLLLIFFNSWANLPSLPVTTIFFIIFYYLKIFFKYCEYRQLP